MDEHAREAMMTTHSEREEGSIFRIGSVAGIVGALLAMVGNLLHPATPSGDPEGVALAIAQSERWVLVHLVIVVGLILMLGGLGALSRKSSKKLDRRDGYTRSAISPEQVAQLIDFLVP